eukprot:5615267-Pyramimonas_sp.AAC.1
MVSPHVHRGTVRHGCILHKPVVVNYTNARYPHTAEMLMQRCSIYQPDVLMAIGASSLSTAEMTRQHSCSHN